MPTSNLWMAVALLGLTCIGFGVVLALNVISGGVGVGFVAVGLALLLVSQGALSVYVVVANDPKTRGGALDSQ